MSWGAVAGAAVGVVGSAMSDSGGGGGQSQSTSKQPWMPATPWLMNNLASGQRLQSQYEAQPFNAQQQQAFGNQANQSAYMRAAVPSLLRQMQGNQIGFDRSNPNARPAAFNWDGLLSAAKDGQAAQGGLLDMLNGSGAVNSSLTPMAEPPKAEEKRFVQSAGYTPEQERYMSMGLTPWAGGQTNQPGGGGYGAYRYGDQPQPGSAAYRDMMEYFMMGGNDPYDLAPAGLGIKSQAVRDPWRTGGGGNSGDSVGGSAAADGSGGGGPGAF